MRRAAAWIGVLAALALVAAGAAIGEGRAREREDSTLPSALSTGPAGLAAARLFLAATGRSSLRLESRGDRPPRGAVLLVSAPGAQLDDDDVDGLLAHARAGGTVVWMGGSVPQPALARRLGLRPQPQNGYRLAGPLAPHPLVAGVLVPSGGGSIDGDPPGALPILGDATFVAGTSVSFGAGEVLVLSGPEALTNERIGDAGSATFLVRLASRGPIVFDERWLRARRGPLPASARRLAAAGLEGLLAFGVWLYARSRRLGAIRPAPPEGRGRTAREYLSSLAGLYRRAGAEEEIARATWRRARRALERRAGIPARLPPDEAAERLARRSRLAADVLRRGEAAVNSGPGALLAVCQAASDLSRAITGGDLVEMRLS